MGESAETLTPSTKLTNQRKARLLVPMFKALADENRMTLALLLAERPHTVKELQEATGMSQTLVSHHLAPLREQSLVTVQARGRSNVYSLCCDQLGAPVRWLAELAGMTELEPESCCGEAAGDV
jgi:DNA-binding transcriptional ArsR family regulator